MSESMVVKLDDEVKTLRGYNAADYDIDVSQYLVDAAHRLSDGDDASIKKYLDAMRDDKSVQYNLSKFLTIVKELYAKDLFSVPQFSDGTLIHVGDAFIDAGGHKHEVASIKVCDKHGRYTLKDTYGLEYRFCMRGACKSSPVEDSITEVFDDFIEFGADPDSYCKRNGIKYSAHNMDKCMRKMLLHMTGRVDNIIADKRNADSGEGGA